MNDVFDSFRGKPEKQGYNSMQTPWQSGYLSDMMGQAQGVYNQGPLTAAANSPLAAQSRGVLGDTLSGKYMDPNTNPYLSAAVNDALGLAGSKFMGMYGGQAGSNLGNSGYQEGLQRTLANTALPYYANAYSQERQNQLNAVPAAQQFDMTAGGAPWADLAGYQRAVSGNYGGSGMQEAPWSNQLWNNMNNMFWGPAGFGSGPQNLSTVGQVLSDERAKENIEKVGTHDETGIGLYKFNYIGDDTPQIGVLAQELEQVKPEAVSEVDGVKFVNFKMI